MLLKNQYITRLPYPNILLYKYSPVISPQEESPQEEWHIKNKLNKIYTNNYFNKILEILKKSSFFSRIPKFDKFYKWKYDRFKNIKTKFYSWFSN